MAEFKPFGWVFFPKMKGITQIEVEQKPVVFCRDCKHYDPDMQSCNNGLDDIFLPDWFCADGERR